MRQKRNCRTLCGKQLRHKNELHYIVSHFFNIVVLWSWTAAIAYFVSNISNNVVSCETLFVPWCEFVTQVRYSLLHSLTSLLALCMIAPKHGTQKDPACALQGIAARWLSAHYKTIARIIARAMARDLGFATPCPNKQGKTADFSKVSDPSGTGCDAVNVREDCKHFGPPLWVVPVEERAPFGGPS